jgi:hypothetical protein
MRQGDYVRVEVHDEGGPWDEHPQMDGRPHGLAIVRALAADSGTDGNALTGWIAWARLDWPGADTPPAGEDRTLPRPARQAFAAPATADSA